MTKTILFNLTPAELEQFVAGIGEQKFRAKQIAEWLWRGAPDFSVMKNLPESLRAKLNDAAQTLPVNIVQKLDSGDGQTTKFLLQMHDGETIETVLMRTTYGNSVCVSSQAGCAMGCRFCASTLLGLKRNLTMNEMLAQVLVADWQLKQSEKWKVESGNNLHSNNMRNEVTHIVIMGTGEPLQNPENIFGFIEALHDKLNIGWRHITLSTCGIVPGIDQMTEWGRPINLAISLHAPNDDLRRQLMPIANKYTIKEILDAASAHSVKTGRQIMIEYILLAGKNDSAERAQELSELLRDKNVMVNLIPWNSVSEREFTAPSGNAVHRFQDALIKNGIHTRIRKERGQDIGSACGQLRLNNN
jgi:23S rRNA (adenine2503-C2)-methyltransferase